MNITKFGHACLLIENNNKKILIDPGVFTFNERFTPEQVGTVDVIVITHNHPDHMSPETIRSFLGMLPAVILGGNEVKADLAKEGIECSVLEPGRKQEIAGFTIESFPAQHGPMPGSVTENHAYLVNNSLLHLGDSYATEDLPIGVKILALPTQGPWARLVDAIACAKTLQPKNVIPIHNAVLKDELGKMFDGYIAEELEKNGIIVKILEVKETWQVA